MRIKKGDTIKIMAGRDKGKAGKILKVFPKKNKVLIDGLNLYKKHIKPKREGEHGETVLVPRPIDVSNVLSICSACGKSVKIGYRFDMKTKIRVCKKCGAAIA